MDWMTEIATTIRALKLGAPLTAARSPVYGNWMTGRGNRVCGRWPAKSGHDNVESYSIRLVGAALVMTTPWKWDSGRPTAVIRTNLHFSVRPLGDRAPT